MSMVVLYARVTPAELDRALADPDWAREHVEELEDADTAPSDGSRVFDLGKAWDGLRYLLTRHGGWPVDFVAGGALFTDDDWGYGPPSYLTPEAVSAVGDFVRAAPFEALAAFYDAEAFTAAAVYPEVWQRVEALEFLGHSYEGLRKFFITAATNGDGVLLWMT